MPQNNKVLYLPQPVHVNHCCMVLSVVPSSTHTPPLVVIEAVYGLKYSHVDQTSSSFRQVCAAATNTTKYRYCSVIFATRRGHIKSSKHPSSRGVEKRCHKQLILTFQDRFETKCEKIEASFQFVHQANKVLANSRSRTYFEVLDCDVPIDNT